jgi:hypothetical protein
VFLDVVHTMGGEYFVYVPMGWDDSGFRIVDQLARIDVLVRPCSYKEFAWSIHHKAKLHPSHYQPETLSGVIL